MAHSLQACGASLCPSCRTVTRTDFDPDSGCLVFSREREPVATVEDLPPEVARQARQRNALAIVSRLVQQTRPFQIKQLANYGSAHPIIQQSSCELDGVTLAAQCMASGLDAPLCVCGGPLERISMWERTRRLIVTRGGSAGPQLERLVEDAISKGQLLFECDICSKRISLTSAAWTCGNGSSTILHANAWDICDECFIKHTGAAPVLNEDGQHAQVDDAMVSSDTESSVFLLTDDEA